MTLAEAALPAQRRSRRIRAPFHGRHGRARRSDARAAERTGAVTFDYGNNLRTQAKHAGVDDAFEIPGFVPEYIRPLFCEGRGPFRWVALSGDPEDIRRTDRLALEIFPRNETLTRWIKLAPRANSVPGIARAHLLAGLRRARRIRPRHERSGAQRGEIAGAHRDRPRSSGRRLGRVAVSRNRSACATARTRSPIGPC